MEHKLSPNQEKIFWSEITKDLSNKLQLREESKEWGKSEKKKIEEEMQIALNLLCKKNTEIQFSCNLEPGDSYKNQLNLFSTIQKIFIDKFFKRTNSFTKNRFTYFLKGIPAAEYINQKGILKKNNTILSTSYALSPHPPPDSIKLYLNHLEDYAERIEKALSEEFDQVTAQNFLAKFTPQHKKIINYIREDRDLVSGMRIKKETDQILNEFLTRKRPNDTPSTSSQIQGLFGFYLRGQSIDNQLNRYLLLVELIREEIAKLK